MKLENGVKRQKPNGLNRKGQSETMSRSEKEPSAFSIEDKETLRIKELSLLEKILDKENILKAAFKVHSNKGAPGIDEVTVNELGDYMKTHWERIHSEILLGKYKPQAVLRVEIPKPDGSKRQLGIPTVIDRVIQQGILQILSPIFEEGFSESSFGFRPKRSAHDAITKAKEYVSSGKSYVVDIDLEKFFDKIQHEVLMKRVARKIKDNGTLILIRSYLKSGIMLDGICVANVEGTPQGGPLSPLLANIMLDDLDKELEKRGHTFCRYADDCNIYVKSQKAGERVKESVTKFIEKALLLKVNKEKSAVDKVSRRKFLGFTIIRVGGDYRITIAQKSIDKFKDKVRELTRVRKNLSIVQRLVQIKEYFRGWLQYFAISENKSIFEKLDSWVRRRLRMCLWVDWKKPKRRLAELTKLGVPLSRAISSAYSRKGKWACAHSKAMDIGLDNTTWIAMGYYCLLLNFQRIRKYQ